MAGEAGTDDLDPDFLKVFQQTQGQAAPGQLTVFMGKGSPRSRGYDPTRDAVRPGMGFVAGPESKMGEDQAIQDFYNWDDRKRQKMGQQLVDLGLIKNAWDYDSIFRVWQSAVHEAGGYFTFGKRKITPYQVISNIFGAGAGGAGGNGPRTTTSKRVNIPTAADAESLVRKIFADQVGRAPTKGEIASYTKEIVAKAKASPEMVTETTKYDRTGSPVSQSSVSKGGFSADAQALLVQNEVQDDPEFGAYQAATHYFNVLQQVIGGS